MSSVPPPPPSSKGGGQKGAPPPPPQDPAGDDAPTEPAADPLVGGDAAMLHQTEATRTYPCGACGGELHFAIREQDLGCAHCGNHQPIQNVSPAPREQDLAAAVAAIREGRFRDAPGQDGDEHEVVCQNCGGHTTFTGTLTATKCPYCATPIQRTDVHEAPARLPVDGVLPFRVDDTKARGNIEEWISSRWFAPNAFKKYSEAGSFQSVYTAYYTYDADTRSAYRGERGDDYTVTVGHGDNRRTETRTRWTPASGNVANDFDDITVFGNTGLDERYVRELEPWPTKEAVGYSPQYVAGHLSRTYDRTVEDCFPEARQRMDAEIKRTVRRDIGGDKQRIHRVKTDYGHPSYKHLLLPIWLLTVVFAGTTYQVFINGVTGEVQGERPYSKVKIALAVIAVLAVVIGFLAFR